MNKQGKSKNYIFTSKSQSEKGVMSTITGLISMTSFIIANVIAFGERGEASMRLGAVGMLSFLLSIASLVLAVMSLKEEEVFPLFPRLGLALAVLSLIAWGYILYVGVMGI